MQGSEKAVVFLKKCIMLIGLKIDHQFVGSLGRWAVRVWEMTNLSRHQCFAVVLRS